ncbi:MAG: DedA family protein, partial [Muribaculaceae bacterium]|nr:DedA family protein [Muribaculaceae bacterium]
MIPLAIFDAAQFFSWFVENANYWFVFIFMVIESSFIPFPSEVIVPPAAYLACTNTGAGSDMNLTMVILIATLGALVGAFINYYLALWIGRPVVYRFADSRFGHACLINREKVDKAEAYFDRHGAISTFIGRLIPAIRQLISIPAG